MNRGIRATIPQASTDIKSLLREAIIKPIPVASTAPSSNVAMIISGCWFMPPTIAMNNAAWPKARLMPVIPLEIKKKGCFQYANIKKALVFYG